MNYDPSKSLGQEPIEGGKLPTSLVLTDEILPPEVLDEIVEVVNEYLASEYGYCTEGYGYNVKIDIDQITWDTED